MSFKGDKKSSKKRKRTANEDETGADSKALATLNASNEASTAPVTIEDDDSWVSADAPSDISGPVLFVLPTEPLSSIATDAAGTVYTIPIENLAEGDSTGLSAEPHDVRQVWIANRVAGTENFSLKGHHGKYLGCDKFGVLSAAKEAVGQEECFKMIPASDNAGVFNLQTVRDKFVAAEQTGGKQPKLRGDTEFVGYETGIRVRMQARFKPRLKKDKEEKAREKISRKELEDMVGRRLGDEEVKRLKRARKDGNFHEAVLDVKVKGKHDKFA